MIRVEGFAMPYNVANSYNEIFRPGSLDEFLAEGGEHWVPMGLMHESPIGRWTKLINKPEGLYVEGLIYYEDAVRFFNKFPEEMKPGGKLSQLSITFVQPTSKDGSHIFSRKRMDQKILSLGQPMPTNFNRRIVECDEITKAALVEISVVGNGAFPGTYVRRIGT